MSMRSVLTLSILCFAPLLLSAAPGVDPPNYSSSQSNARTPSATTAKSTSTPNCTDLSNSTGAVYPSCWDILGMDEWMFEWNSATMTCKGEEIWSTCFLRLAYGSAGYDCSTLGNLKCVAPQLGGPVTDARVFYGAFSIYAINLYLSTWETALYALRSQSAIAQLALILGADGTPGLPRLTTASLLVAVVSRYGLDPAADGALISILPSGRRATSLDTHVTEYSAQLATLLGQVLGNLSNFWGEGFSLLAQHGQMMAQKGETLAGLETRLAGGPVGSEEALEEAA